MLRYRGRVYSDEDVAFIRQLIANNPSASRRALSQMVCTAWDWVLPNGALCDAVCRGLLLALHRSEQIELPPPRWIGSNPGGIRHPPPEVELDRRPVSCSLRELGPLEYRQARKTPAEPLFNSLLAQHHYLGYTQPVGAHLKYLVHAGERPVAALSFSSAPRHLRPRDRFIGWSPEARRKSIRSIAYNPRFLIPPWVQVPHLASHVLGAIVRRISGDWESLYNHPLYFLETFVDRERYRGTCYRAANWIVLGETTGRGHNAQTHRPTRSIKQVLGYPLSRRFREQLCHGKS
jgi:hypothetical protein